MQFVPIVSESCIFYVVAPIHLEVCLAQDRLLALLLMNLEDAVCSSLETSVDASGNNKICARFFFDRYVCRATSTTSTVSVHHSMNLIVLYYLFKGTLYSPFGHVIHN